VPEYGHEEIGEGSIAEKSVGTLFRRKLCAGYPSEFDNRQMIPLTAGGKSKRDSSTARPDRNRKARFRKKRTRDASLRMTMQSE
jgi:hypothetical protein